jgi:hypothetical protein
VQTTAWIPFVDKQQHNKLLSVQANNSKYKIKRAPMMIKKKKKKTTASGNLDTVPTTHSKFTLECRRAVR